MQIDPIIMKQLALLALCWGFSSAGRTHASETISEPFLGVRLIEVVNPASIPRPLYLNIVEIDLSEPTLSFKMTPRRRWNASKFRGHRRRDYPPDDSLLSHRAKRTARDQRLVLRRRFHPQHLDEQ